MNADPKQPLYVGPAERVTLEQLKLRAAKVTDLAVRESKRVANEVYEESFSKTVLIVVGVVVVAASLAYFMGSRAARRAEAPAPQPPYGY